MKISVAEKKITRSEQIQKSLKQAIQCAKIAEDYKGKDTVLLDLTDVTPMFDFFIITSGTSRRQMHAIVEEVDRVLKEQGSKRLGLEGHESNHWILQDYGDIVLHVFDQEMRKVYDLESLWADAKVIDWQSA